MAIEVWDDVSTKRFWDNNQSPYSGDIVARELVRLAKRYIRGVVVDVGAGSGALLELLPSAVGVDISPKHNRTIKGSIISMPFGAGSVDTVFATDVLEHLSDHQLASGIDEIRRILSVGGHVIVTVPNQEHMGWNMIGCPSCGTVFHRWGHRQTFDVNAIRLLLDRFSVTRISVLPLSLMSEHWLIRRFWRLFLLAGYCRADTILAVARKDHV